MSYSKGVSPTSPEKDHFWVAREGARKIVLLILLGTDIYVQLSDPENTFNMIYLLPIVPILLILALKSKCSTQLVFDFVITFLSCGMCTQASYVSMNLDKPMENLHVSDKVMIVTMKDGVIPLTIMFGLLAPILTLPIGMNINVAKIVTIFNISVTTNTFYHIHMNMISNESRNNILISRFRFNLLNCFILVSVGSMSCFSAAEAVDRFIQRMDGDVQADAMLNNVLKNSIAGAACLLEIEQEEMELSPCGKCGTRPRLTQVRKQLSHSMRWCMSRQVMVELASGTYTSVKTEVDVASFLEDTAIGFDNCTTSVLVDEDDNLASVKFDKSMASLATENALLKMVSTGEGGPISLTGRLHVQAKQIEFILSNRLAEVGIPSEVQGQVEKSKHHMKLKALNLATVHSSAGLHRINMAVCGAGGSFNISHDKDNATVTMSIRLPMEAVEAPNTMEVISSIVSGSSKSIASTMITPLLPSSTVTLASAVKPNPSITSQSNLDEAVPSSESDRALDIPRVKRKLEEWPATAGDSTKRPKEETAGPSSFPADLKVCAIDDSKLICKGYERLLLPQLKSNVTESYVCCAKSKEEVDTFVQFVLGIPRGDGNDTMVNCRPADIVILDQNIDLSLESGLATVLGTDLAVKLREHSFRGLVIIRSANSNSNDFEFYMSTRAVDFCAGKSESHKDLAARIKSEFLSSC